jgi:tetratricopeptide (TPR) repeat protein
MTRAARTARRSEPPRSSVQSPGRSLRDRLLGERPRDLLVLAALATALYANSFGVGLILDSQLLILQDPRIRAVRSENLRSILTEDYIPVRPFVSGVYRPLTTLSYLANYAVLGNGPRPAGYHAVNLLLHVANAALVYLLVGIVLRSRAYAFWTAALFTAHPIATEAVTNVIGRADLLAALAVLGGTLLYIRSTQAAGRAKVGWLVGLSVVTALGLLAKENAIAIVGVVLLYDLTFRLRSSSARPLADTLGQLGEFFRAGYVAFLPALLAVGWLRWRVYADTVVQRPPFIDNPLVGADFWSARLTALKVLGRSVALLAWPRTLSWDYSYDQIALVRWPLEGWEDWQAPLALVGLVAAGVVAVRSRRRQPGLCFFLLFALVTMLPTANLIVSIGTIMAERFLYLPSVGFAACVVLGLAAVAERLRRPRASVMMPMLVALVVAAFGLRTVARNWDWCDELRLAQSGIEAAPRSAKVYWEYASTLSHRDGLERADVEALIAHAEQALSIMEHPPLPTELQVSNIPLLLGIYYKTKGTQLASRGEDGREWYGRAAAMLERATQIEAAHIDEYRRARLRRGLGEEQIAELGGQELPYHLGEVYLLLGEPAKAAAAFDRLRRLAPLAAQSHVSVARAAMATGDLERAVRSLTIAVALGRRDAETQGLMVDAYRRLDPHGCAVSERGDHRQVEGSCPIVRANVCAAYAELVEISIGARQWELGRRVGEAAIRTRDCEPAPFEQLLARLAEQRR